MSKSATKSPLSHRIGGTFSVLTVRATRTAWLRRELKRQLFLWGLILTGYWAILTPATEMPQAFLKGIEHYKSGEYADAIDAFLTISDHHINNGFLFYNIGNAYLKNNDLGYAILWYERALKLNPKDPDLKFNYEYAQSLLKDEQENRTPAIYHILFFWYYFIPPRIIKWLAILFNFLFWGMLIINRLQKKMKFKSVVYASICLTILFTATAIYHFYASKYLKYAIVLPENISVRSGLTKDATTLFSLHEGTKVKIDKAFDGYFRITFSDGKIGWIEQSVVGII